MKGFGWCGVMWKELPLGISCHKTTLCLRRLGSRTIKDLRFSRCLQVNMLAGHSLLDARRRHGIS